MNRKTLRLLFWIPAFRHLIRFLKRKKVHKKREITLYIFISSMMESMRNYSMVERANNVAFNFTLAIFPAVIFIFTLIPYLPIENLDQLIMEYLHQEMPDSMYQVASHTIADIVSRPRGDLLSIGVLAAIFLATNGMMAIISAFNRIYRSREKRSFLKTRAVAAVLTLILSFILVISVMLFVVGQQIIYFLRDELGILENYTIYLIYGLRFIVIFMLFFLAISFIYYLGPSVERKWKFFSLGSFIASLLCIGASVGFSIYINNFATYNKFYGSIGVLIALMLWLSIISSIILFGFQINATNERLKKIFVSRG